MESQDDSQDYPLRDSSCDHSSLSRRAREGVIVIYVPNIRFPTSLTGNGSDAMCGFVCVGRGAADLWLLTRRTGTSTAIIPLHMCRCIDSNLVGHGMTFTIGRGNDIVSSRVARTCQMYSLDKRSEITCAPWVFCQTIDAVTSRLVDKEIKSLFVDMGKA